jgi:hypothetical protein
MGPDRALCSARLGSAGPIQISWNSDGTYFTFSRGDEGLGVALITWPAVATCFYSVGIVVASRPAITAVGAGIRRAVVRSPLTKLARMF